MPAPRDVLAAALKPILPRDWAIKATGASIDDIPTTVVRIRQRTIKRLPQAPIGQHLVGLVIEVSAPEQGVQRAEDTLDEQIDDFIHALDTLKIRWTGAEKVAPSQKRIAYEITLDVLSKKE